MIFSMRITTKNKKIAFTDRGIRKRRSKTVVFFVEGEKMILQTKRLILRPILISDAEDIFEYSKEPNVGPNAGWKPHVDIDETINIIKEIFIGKTEIFGIV